MLERGKDVSLGLGSTFTSITSRSSSESVAGGRDIDAGAANAVAAAAPLALDFFWGKELRVNDVRTVGIQWCSEF